MSKEISISELSDSREVMMTKAPVSISVFIFIVIIIFVTTVLLGSFSQIEQYSKVSGEVRPDDMPGTLATVSGGEIAHVYYTSGERINEGDIILKFETGSVAEQKKSLEDKRDEENLKIANYNKLKESIELGKNLFSSSKSEEPYYHQYENYLATLNQQIEQLDQSNNKIESSKKELTQSIEAAAVQLSQHEVLLVEYKELYKALCDNTDYSGSNFHLQILYQDYKGKYDEAQKTYFSYKELYENQINESTVVSVGNSADVNVEATTQQESIEQTKSLMDTAESDMNILASNFLVTIDTSIEEYSAKIEDLRTQREAYELQRSNLTDPDSLLSEMVVKDKVKTDLFVSINDAIESSNIKITEIEDEMISMKDVSGEATIKAQSDGILVYEKDLVKGDAVPAGSSIGKIIPDGNSLKVILYIPEKNIAKVKVGYDIEYIINALPVSEYGKINGKVRSISADSFFDEASGQKLYKAEATLNAIALADKSGETRALQTGMIVDARIINGSQSVLAWVLDKLNFAE